MITPLVSAVANVLVCLVLVHYIGLWGAFFGTFVAYFVMAISRMVDVSRYIQMKIDIGRFVVNSIILMTEAVLVSLEIKIYLVSSIAIVLFVIVNMRSCKDMLGNLKGRNAQ